MASERPELQIAWQYRHITNEQIAAADREFRELEALHFRVTQQPDDDQRKQQALAQLEARGQQLGYMMNARKMLDRAWKDVVKRAEKVLPQIDIEQTQLHMEVAAAVRGQSQAAPPADPPIAWGRLDNVSFRQMVRSKFGYDPGV